MNWGSFTHKILRHSTEPPALVQREGDVARYSLSYAGGWAVVQSIIEHLTSPSSAGNCLEKSTWADVYNSWMHDKLGESAVKDGLNLGQAILNSA